jgi:prepilin-type N-terminal cleavage/methylation domain-containing protein
MSIPMKNKGFTLIELIVSLVLIGFVGTMLVTFMSNAVVKSVTPLQRVGHANTIGQVFENITSDYKRLSEIDRGSNTSVALSTLKDNIDNGNDVNNTPYYGPYAVVNNDYISFDGGGNQIQDNGDQRILKVTLSSDDQKMTSLFTR